MEEEQGVGAPAPGTQKDHDESVEILPTLRATSLMSSTTMAASTGPTGSNDLEESGGGGGSLAPATTNLRRSTTTPHARRQSHFEVLIAQRRQEHQRHLHVSVMAPTTEEEEQEADEETLEAAASPGSREEGSRFGRASGRNNNSSNDVRESTFQNVAPDKFEQLYLQNNQDRLVQVVLRDYSYHVPIKTDAPSIKTVLNQSVCYGTYEFFRRVHNYCQRHKKADHNKPLAQYTFAHV